ncbi:MAG: hypothetical protein OEO79_07785 [Gemmatimonadota bacterium]|nr:hypothetical protein [Gemmatimonadota bacterium]MDH3423089.1 hypothetical protein [Gemmatimonadota bacterium]
MPTAATAIRSASTVLCAFLCIACTSGVDGWSSGSTGYPLAYFHDDCAPWDGPALTILLTHTELESPFEQTVPNVRVTSYRPPAVLAGASFEWEGDAPDLGYGRWCEFFDDCWSATTVRVRFDRVQDSEDELAGQVYLVFEGGRVVSGAFTATRLPLQMLCG